MFLPEILRFCVRLFLHETKKYGDFSSPALYVPEYLNLQLYDLAKKYHHALSKVDISQLEGSYQGNV